MANNYRAIEAFARGLMSALLRDGETETKAPRQQFIKTEDIEKAVAKYIDTALAGTPPQGEYADAHEVQHEQQQTEMDFGGGFIPPEMRDLVRENVGDLSTIPQEKPEDPATRAPHLSREDEYQSRTYDPDMPGEGVKWQTPRS